MTVKVVTAAEAAELDRRAIAGGTPSRALMQAAGRATARAIVERYGDDARRGVAVYAGPGNNGGDAWVVAGELARAGLRVRVHATGTPRTPDAIAERTAALPLVDAGSPDATAGVVVDGLLGTGAAGAPRAEVADAIARIATRHATARVVAVDIPSGVDATSGATPGASVRADCTVTYGSVKRGLLLNRDAAGHLLVADIGLAAEAAAWGELPALVDDAVVRAIVPPIAADSHKGTRKRLVIVGGAAGMAGASILAARAAMRSGIGMTKLCVARESLDAVQGGEPAAMAAAWPESADEARALGEWAHAILIGPGLGRASASFAVLERVLRCFAGPVVLDADALSLFEGQPAQLATLLDGRPAVITPHEMEFSRLTGMSLDAVGHGRFEVAADLARALGCTVLLKGVPTVVSDGNATDVSAAGSPVLATAGSGDVLGGIVATLLAQTGQGRQSAAAAAWVHGRAAERAGGAHVRGATLDDVLGELRAVWSEVRPGDAGVRSASRQWLAELPAVGERG